MSTDQDIARFHLKSPAATAEIETVEIYHPAFVGREATPHRYRPVANANPGIDVALEDDTPASFEPCPMKIDSLGAKDDLEAGLRIELGDLGEILGAELDAVAAADAATAEGDPSPYETKPTIWFRTYRSDELGDPENLAKPLVGPLLLEAGPITVTGTGAWFEARAPRVIGTGVGESYRIERFPMLRGAL